ncbi:beta-1,3-galactosyltransferase 1-like isoform X1 [Atheta coriaria]|uniref:beta-1,3-galactosyltransferase 1-like isoform X1 n=1 Tax=Dalotia coriaria TaxID=877792 RepID=UPI0031F42FA4
MLDRRLTNGKLKKFILGIIILTFLIGFIYNTAAPRKYVESTSDFGSVEGWEYNTSRDASLYLDNSSSILKPKHFCESVVFLRVVVSSAPVNLQNRVAIRETWGSQHNISGMSIKVYFLLGDSTNASVQADIIKENEIYNDIVQERFIDSYNNLTLKSIAMLKTFSTFCMQTTTFLMKTDDDMYLNMRPLISMLNSTNTTNVMVGSLICGAKPIKDINNKWYTPSYMYRDRIYPNYLSGTGYVMSIDVVPKLYEAALITPIFHLEDIYITGMLSRVIHVRPRNNGGFTFQKRKFDPCVFKTAFTSHRLSPSEIHDQYLLLETLDLAMECKLQEEMAARSLNNLLGIFTMTKSKPKKKKIVCF